MAVGHEWAHAEFVGQGEGLVVVSFGLLALRGLAPRRNVAEEAQGIRLVAPFLVLTGVRQRALGEDVGFLQAASQQLRLSQREPTERLKVHSFHYSRLFYRLREQRHGVGDAPAQGIRRTQGRSYQGEIRSGGLCPDRCPWPVRAGGVPWAGRLGGGPADRSPTRPT